MSREAFDAFVEERCYYLDRYGNQCKLSALDFEWAWEAWQAAQAEMQATILAHLQTCDPRDDVNAVAEFIRDM